jgi:hypothetical protein
MEDRIINRWVFGLVSAYVLFWLVVAIVSIIRGS